MGFLNVLVVCSFHQVNDEMSGQNKLIYRFIKFSSSDNAFRVL